MFFRRISILIFFIGVLFNTLYAVEQNKEHLLTGKIIDAKTGEVLISASIYNVTAQIGTVTDTLGFFTFKLPTGKYSFLISYLGYKTKEVEIELNSNLGVNISLESEIHELGEIIIRGKKRE